MRMKKQIIFEAADGKVPNRAARVVRASRAIRVVRASIAARVVRASRAVRAVRAAKEAFTLIL